jgi:hypothetical protein
LSIVRPVRLEAASQGVSKDYFRHLYRCTGCTKVSRLPLRRPHAQTKRILLLTNMRWMNRKYQSSYKFSVAGQSEQRVRCQVSINPITFQPSDQQNYYCGHRLLKFTPGPSSNPSSHPSRSAVRNCVTSQRNKDREHGITVRFG